MSLIWKLTDVKSSKFFRMDVEMICNFHTSHKKLKLNWGSYFCKQSLFLYAKRKKNAYGNCDELTKSKQINAETVLWRIDGERVKLLMTMYMITSKSERKKIRVLTTQRRCEENKWKRKYVDKDLMTALKEKKKLKTSEEEDWKVSLKNNKKKILKKKKTKKISKRNIITNAK